MPPDATPEPPRVPSPDDLGPADRFTIKGKPIPFDVFVRTVMGDLAERAPVAPEPQPVAPPWEIVWRSRRPLPRDAAPR